MPLAADSAPQVVPVHLSERSYEIELGRGRLSHLGSFLLARRKCTRAILITDAQVQPLYGRAACASLESAGITCKLLVVPAGEGSKSVDVLSGLWEQVLAAGADRKTVVIALGGGVVGDLAGFVAASFARGLPFLQVPTTLLAQVDSSVGGKVGINLPGAKNMVGAFWQPIGVLIDTATLATLPEREYRAGLAEVVKYGIILDEPFFSLLEANVQAINEREPGILQQVIARCCELKALVVRDDEREETGLRAVLNYGHTFAHAFEAATGYGELLHGEAVSLGMVCAARLAARLGRVDEAFCQRQDTLLQQFGLPLQPPALDPQVLIDLMRHDKKVEHGRLRFVLPTHLGQVELVGDVPAEEVLHALSASE